MTTEDIQQLTLFPLLFARVCLHNLTGFTGYSFWLHEVVIFSCLWLYEWVADALTFRNTMHMHNLLNYMSGRWGLAPLLMLFAIDGFEGWQRVFWFPFKMKAQKKMCPKEDTAEIQEAVGGRKGGLGGWWLSSKTVKGNNTWEVEATYFCSLELVYCKILFIVLVLKDWSK